VTCLVGKNESGKTTFLQALHRLNPFDGSSSYNDVMDYPAKDFAVYERVRDRQPAAVVTAIFEFEDREAARIEEDLGAGVLLDHAFSVTKRYPPGKTSYDVKIDEAAAVRHLARRLTKDLDLPEWQAERLQQSTTIADLIEAGEAIDAGWGAPITIAVTELREQYESWPEMKLVTRRLIPDYLSRWLPRFVFFDSYGVLEGKVSIPQLRRRRDARELEDADRTILALLSMVGVRLEDFQDASNYERLTRKLEAAAKRITDLVFRYWTQNKQLSVVLDIDSPEPGAPSQLNEGPILHVRIHNQRHGVTVPFDERSRGFVSFISFLAYFSELEDSDDGHRVILLLDEPGLNLHATAQRDLLKLIDERLTPRHQIVYATHSPFMIQADQLDRVRIVQDVDEEGTKVSAEVLRTDSGTVFPLQAALGYDLAQTLFLGPHNLLVEGPSEILYIQLFNRALAAKDMAILDERWVLVPIGGIGKAAPFVSLFGGNQLNVAVLMDSSSKNTQTIKKLKTNPKLGNNALVLIGEATGTEDADIEDLFDPAFYLELFNGAYRAKLSHPLTPAELPQGDPRIVRRLEQHLRGEFNHYRPADYFRREQATLLPRLDSATLERVEKLFRRINELLQQA
jgi:predicted ATP-dependent endonuclease of OLD family